MWCCISVKCLATGLVASVLLMELLCSVTHSGHAVPTQPLPPLPPPLQGCCGELYWPPWWKSVWSIGDLLFQGCSGCSLVTLSWNLMVSHWSCSLYCKCCRSFDLRWTLNSAWMPDTSVCYHRYLLDLKGDSMQGLVWRTVLLQWPLWAGRDDSDEPLITQLGAALFSLLYCLVKCHLHISDYKNVCMFYG